MVATAVHHLTLAEIARQRRLNVEQVRRWARRGVATPAGRVRLVTRRVDGREVACQSDVESFFGAIGGRA